jgi:CubicO group peptidase (beta-lactamase class C family)
VLDGVRCVIFVGGIFVGGIFVGLAPPTRAQEVVAARMEALRARAGVPALGGALVTLEGEPEVWVAGTRRAGGDERVTPDDLWHLGSCTKSMTATLVALLVARGDLRLEIPLGEALPEAPRGSGDLRPAAPSPS